MWKVLHNGSVVDVLDRALWVHQGPGLLLLCREPIYEGVIPDDAQGVMSRDESTAYQLEGRNKLDDADLLEVSVVSVSESEAESLLLALQRGEDDPEDTEPTPAEDGNTGEIMTRAELTAKAQEQDTVIADLREQLAAAKILLGVDE